MSPPLAHVSHPAGSPPDALLDFISIAFFLCVCLGEALAWRGKAGPVPCSLQGTKPTPALPTLQGAASRVLKRCAEQPQCYASHELQQGFKAPPRVCARE